MKQYKIKYKKGRQLEKNSHSKVFFHYLISVLQNRTVKPTHHKKLQIDCNPFYTSSHNQAFVAFLPLH